MQIQDSEIYKLNFFTYGKPFTGSCGNLRYRIIREQGEGGEAILAAAVYPCAYCWEATEDAKKIKQEFPFSEEGREEMLRWLNEKVGEELW